jgi:hypothetical protein
LEVSARTPERCWNLAASPSPGLPKLDRIRHLRNLPWVLHGCCTAMVRILPILDPRCVHVLRTCDHPFSAVRYLCRDPVLNTFSFVASASATHCWIGFIPIQIIIHSLLSIGAFSSFFKQLPGVNDILFLLQTNY